MSKVIFDNKLVEEIEKDYKSALQTFGKCKCTIRDEVALHKGNEALFLKYLYAHMPVSDACGYSFEIIDSYAKHAAFLNENSEFLEGVSPRYFLQYVLAHRINSEDITDCRRFFYDLVHERVRGMTRAQAVIEANNWCYEQATYRSTSIRTESPITMYKSGFGRCGEESTFLTTVLRSLGIPARQVYVPRWSHSDSNHAWVEIWCEDGWHFTGACEPNPVLDSGWFPYAASRAMVVHSRLFDNADSTGEEVTETDGLAVLLNESARYSHQTELTVYVSDAAGKPVKGAKVAFEIVNSAEMFPIASLMTDNEGKVHIHLGKGDVHIAVTVNGMYTEKFVDLRSENEVNVQFGNPVTETDEWRPYHINAPESAEGFAVNMTKAQENEQNARNALGDVIRTKRIDSYFDAEYAENWKEYEHIYEALKRAKGNFDELRRFLDKDFPGIDKSDKDMLFEGISDKDCRDITVEVLEDSLSAFEFKNSCPREVFVNNLLSPRIHYARTTAFRNFIRDNLRSLSELAVNNPQMLWNLIDADILTDSQREYLTIMSDPAAVFKAGSASLLSKYTAFVAVCRTFGRPARIDMMYERPQYYDGKSFRYVHRELEKKGKLLLICKDAKDPEYGQSFTIGRRTKEGNYETVGAWFAQFSEGKLELELAEGEYRILTCERTSSGSIAGRMLNFKLVEGECKKCEMSCRELKREDFIDRRAIPTIRGSLVGDTEMQTVVPETGKRAIVIFARPGAEPTEHVFNELLEISRMGGLPSGEIYIMLENGNSVNDPTLTAVLSTYADTQVRLCNFEETIGGLSSQTGVVLSNLPYICVLDDENTSLYCCSGYNVGCVDIFARLLADE